MVGKDGLGLYPGAILPALPFKASCQVSGLPAPAVPLYNLRRLSSAGDLRDALDQSHTNEFSLWLQ